MQPPAAAKVGDRETPAFASWWRKPLRDVGGATQVNTSQRGPTRVTRACKSNDPHSFPLTFPRSGDLALGVALRVERNGLENR
jgi:hypothetical protein